MLVFLQAVFISVIVLHQANIWVTLIPNPSITFIVTAMLLLAATVNDYFSVKGFHRTFVLSFFGMIILLFTQLASMIWGGASGGGNRGINSLAAYLFLTFLCLIIVFRWKPKQETFCIRVYVVACSIMSLLGFVAWLVVTVTWVSRGEIDPAHLVDIGQLTGGQQNRIEGDVEAVNEFGIGENTYSFPYAMGVVLTNSYLYEFFGFQFFRASSWYNEPTSIWFMVIPALVLTFNKSYFSRPTRIVLLVMQFCFLLASFSVSIILSLLSIYVLRRILYISGPSRTRPNKRKTIAYVVFIMVVLAFVGYYAFYYVPEGALARNILSSKISSGDYVSTTLGNAFNPVFGIAYWYLLVVALTCSWRAARANDANLMSFSLVVLCFLIVGLKGSFYHLTISPGFFVFFFLMLKHLDLALAPRFQNMAFPLGRIA